MSMTREEAIGRIQEHIHIHSKKEPFTPYLDKAFDMAIEALKEQKPHGECRTCKHYTHYREQFSYRNRGDGYCKSNITTSEGQAYINCHDEWYCANYEKGGESE